jgi:hypothetical protein
MQNHVGARNNAHNRLYFFNILINFCSTLFFYSKIK